MKKAHLWLIIILILTIIVLTVLLCLTYTKLNETLIKNTELEQEIISLQNRVGFFPMTNAEEDLFQKNFKTIQTVFPEGDLAYNAAQTIHEYHRIGTMPIGYITFAESVSYGSVKQLHFITSDNIDYYMVFSDGSVVGFWKETASGDQLLFGYVQ